MAKYHRLSFAERCRIEQLKKQGHGVRSIARALCRSASAISDELNRRFTKYNAKTAQKDLENRSNPIFQIFQILDEAVALCTQRGVYFLLF